MPKKLTKKQLANITEFDAFEPFDVAPRDAWLLDLAAKHDVELAPEGCPFQTGVLKDITQTPGYTMSIAGSQTGKSRALLIEAIIMATGRVPISMQYEQGVDTGVPRFVNDENIERFGQREDGGCGNIVGVGVYPKEKIPGKDSFPQIWIASYKEVKLKMWKTRLEQLIPPETLELNRDESGWNDRQQMFIFNNGAQIRLITYEQQYKKTEGEMAWMIILDEEPPIREYFVSALEHCKYLRLCFSPINGLQWSYYDCYLPAIEGTNKNVNIYSCTQFDSPYRNSERVKAKLKGYRAYEVKCRIFGRFSNMAGKPYYTYEITQDFLKHYVPRHTLARILPISKPETVKAALNIKMRLEPAEKEDDDVWEIYEKYNEFDAYWITADVGEGNENPNLAQNASAAYVRRLPHEDEKDPVMVASLYSRMRNVEFAWLCLYGACFYNMALLAPETGVSVDGAVFCATLLGYPYFYRHTSTNYKTHRLQEKVGFDTKANTRKYAFDLVGTWIYEHIENSKIYHYQLLKEISECIIGDKGRPDHPDRGSDDCLMAFGISEYVYDLCKNQIKCNRYYGEDQVEEQPAAMTFPNIRGLNAPVRESRPVLGSRRGLDSRFGVGRQTRKASPRIAI